MGGRVWVDRGGGEVHNLIESPGGPGTHEYLYNVQDVQMRAPDQENGSWWCQACILMSVSKKESRYRKYRFCFCHII